MHKHIHTNKSKHSKMDPLRQNPIQKTVRTARLNVLMIVQNFSRQYNTEQFRYSPLLPPEKHYNSDRIL